MLIHCYYYLYYYLTFSAALLLRKTYTRLSAVSWYTKYHINESQIVPRYGMKAVRQKEEINVYSYTHVWYIFYIYGRTVSASRAFFLRTYVGSFGVRTVGLNSSLCFSFFFHRSVFTVWDVVSTIHVNPFRTAVPFWGQISKMPSNLSPTWDCGTKMVNNSCRLIITHGT